jgi:hypothetical protein
MNRERTSSGAGFAPAEVPHLFAAHSLANRLPGSVIRASDSYRRDGNLDLRLAFDVPSGELRIWGFVEGNPVNDGVVFWIGAVGYDLAVKSFGDTPAGGVLYGHGIEETSFAESCVSPLNKCSHDFPAKTFSVRAFLEPKTEFRRNRISAFERGHAKAFPVIEPPDDERKPVRIGSLRSLLTSRHVLAPRWRLPWHESGDGGRDACKNFLCIRHLELAELQSGGLDDNHCVSPSTTDHT